MTEIPPPFRDLAAGRTIAHVVTLTPSGMPHATPVWIDFDDVGGHFLVNTELHRRKTRNVRQDPRVAVSMTDPDDPYRYLSVMGRVSEITTLGAREHIDALARRYLDVDAYPAEIRSERVILRIEPLEVLTSE